MLGLAVIGVLVLLLGAMLQPLMLLLKKKSSLSEHTSQADSSMT